MTCLDNKTHSLASFQPISDVFEQQELERHALRAMYVTRIKHEKVVRRRWINFPAKANAVFVDTNKCPLLYVDQELFRDCHVTLLCAVVQFRKAFSRHCTTAVFLVHYSTYATQTSAQTAKK